MSRLNKSTGKNLIAAFDQHRFDMRDFGKYLHQAETIISGNRNRDPETRKRTFINLRELNFRIGK